MKLLGYQRIKGVTKEGKEYDFVNLVVEKDFTESTSESGGSQIVVNRQNGRLPSVSTQVFTNALRGGMKVGSDIVLYRDFENNIILGKA